MRAFTLVEILIVVIILGILAAIVVPQFASASNPAYQTVAKSVEEALRSGVAMYLKTTHRFPSSFDQWVSYGGTGSNQNFVFIGNSIRSQLADPNALVGTTSQTIVLQFKNGLTGTYHIDSNGNITATYTGP